MSAPISIREVAAHAGVSVGTVSNVLNRPDIVAQPTRDRVNAAIKALGFVRNESARQLRAGRSRTIGLVVLDVANPFFTDVARGVEDDQADGAAAPGPQLARGFVPHEPQRFNRRVHPFPGGRRDDIRPVQYVGDGAYRDSRVRGHFPDADRRVHRRPFWPEGKCRAGSWNVSNDAP